MPLSEVVELAWQLAAGLEVARLVGVVHRDLKPQNVFRAVGDAEGHRQADWQLIARVRERVRWPARQLATAVAVASGLRTHVSGIRTARP